MNRAQLRLTRLEDRAVPAVATWDGGGADNKWTTAANWQGDAAPQPGDDLVFPAEGAAQRASVNDFPAGTGFRSITLAGVSYNLSGNTVTLAAGVHGTADVIAVGGPTVPQITFDIVLAGPQTFTNTGITGYTLAGAIDLSGALTVAADYPGTVYFTGPVRGAGGLVKDGPGSLVLSGANTYTGPTDLQAGIVLVFDGSAFGATGAGNGTTVGPDAVLEVGGAGGLLPIDVPDAITFTGRTAQNQDPLLVSADQTAILSGPLTLAGAAAAPTRFAVLSGGRLTITGGVSAAGGPQDLQLYGAIPGFPSLAPEGVIAFGPAAVNAGTVRTVVEGGRVLFDGGAADSPVSVSLATVGGAGTLGPVTAGAASILDPGDATAAGVLTSGDLAVTAGAAGGFADGTLAIDLFAPSGALAADRVAVRGTVRLGGQLRVRSAGTAPLPAGGTVTIIDNDGADPVQGTFLGLPEGAVVRPAGGRAFRISYRGGDGNDVTLADAGPAAVPRFAVGAGAGGGPQVNVYAAGGALVRSFNAYDPAFRGGVRVASGDLTGDGVPDVVTGPGPAGGPDIRVFDGASGALVRELLAYDPAFTGGVFVAVGDTNGDGTPDIVTGAGPGGGPHVKVFDGRTSGVLSSFYGEDINFRGGVTVAAGDVAGDRRAEVIFALGAGASGGPAVIVTEADLPTGGAGVTRFLAYDPAFRGGVSVATGDVNGDGILEVITGAEPGGGPHVKAFSIRPGFPDPGQVTVASFLAYDLAFTGGVTVAAADVDGDGVAEIITGAGPGGGPHVRAFHAATAAEVRGFLAFDPAFTGGVFVG